MLLKYIIVLDMMMEESLRKKIKHLEHYKNALDCHSIVAETDAAGNITYVNDKFCELSEYARDELMGSNHRILNSGHHAPEFFKELWRVCSSGETWNGNIKNRKKYGGYYWVKTTIVPFKNETGRVTSHFAIRTDITDQVESELKYQAANNRLKQLTDKLKLERLALNRKNIALNELISVIEEDKQKIYQNLSGYFDSILFPILDQLTIHSKKEAKSYFDFFKRALTDATKYFEHHQVILDSRFSPKEIQICNWIRKGSTVKEISAFYNLSPRTIEKHRENIRKKLGLTDKKINLSTYLANLD